MNTADKLQQTTLATPLGKLTVVASPRGVQAVLWPGEASAFPIRSEGHAAAILRAAADQLGEYFSGQRTAFDLPLDLLGTPFQIAVWEVLRGIPFGATISYGEQARRLGDSRKARAVGSANGRNPIPIIVPCHRVIGSDGSLTGFAAGMETKAWLLRHEQPDAKG